MALLAAGCVLAAVLVAPGPSAAAPAVRIRALQPGDGRRRARWPGLLARGRRRGPAETDAALVLDLVAAALTAGAPVPAALAVVGNAVGGSRGAQLRGVADRLRLGAGEDTGWAAAGGWADELRQALSLSARTGAPAAGLLRDRAGELRRRRRRGASAAAQRLAVRVVLPLGLCALPGFAAWGVVPVVLGLASGVMSP